MRLRDGVSRLAIIAMLITVVLPLVATRASAQETVSLSGALEADSNNQLPRMIKGVSSAPLLSDNDVLNYLESTLIKPKATTKHGINSSVSASSLSFIKKSRDRVGQDHYLYQNTLQGIPVYGEYARVHLDASRRVKMIQNGLSGELGAVDTTARVTATEAIDIAKTHLEQVVGYTIEWESTMGTVKSHKPEANLLIYPQGYKNVLAYEVSMTYIRPESGSWIAYVNAITGTIIEQYSTINYNHGLNPANAITGEGKGYNGDTRALNLYYDVSGDINPDDAGKYYLIDVTKDMFDMNHTGEPGDNVIVTLDYELGDIPNVTSTVYDKHAVDAHYNTSVVYDFYEDNYGWSGIDGTGGSIISVVHAEDSQYPGLPYDNAFWNGLYISYGDGAGIGNGGNNCYACALDVVAHEFTHAVTEYTAGLEYRNQSGALNESISDIMAAVIDHDDWTMGEDTGKAIRSMDDPHSLSQPAHMDDYNLLYNRPVDDLGGVHINSGIPNHAAYLMAEGMDAFFSLKSIQLDGKAVLGELTIELLNNYLTSTSDFQDARDSYIAAAEDYAVELSLAEPEAFVDIIKGAWEAVGLPEGAYTLTRIKSIDPNVDNYSGAPASIDDYLEMADFFVPYGTDLSSLTPVIVTSNDTEAIPESELNFNDGNYVPYSITTTDAVYSTSWLVGAIEEPILQYSGTVFSEASTNRGSIASGISVKLINDVFNGNLGTDLITTQQVTVSGVPTGLAASVIMTSDTVASITLSGSAAAHANANDTSNLKVTFNDSAFYYFRDYQVTNGEQLLSIDFADPVRVGGGGGGGGGGGIPTPPTPESEVTEDGIVYKPSAKEMETLTDDNGNTTTNVTLSDDSIDNLIDLLEKEGSKQEFTIQIDDNSDAAQLQISAANLLKIAISSSNAVIIVKSGSSSYQLPIGLLDLDALAAELNGTTDHLTITLRMEKIEGEIRSSFLTSARGAGAALLGDAIDFSILAQSNDSSKEINDFGKTYVRRTMTVNGSVSPSDASVVVFNPTTNRLSFVPATFKTIGGNTEVTIKRNGNSIYGVVSTKKISFNDVQKHWASDDIEFLASRMIISGFNESTFKPNDNITRAQFGTMLVQALGLSTSDDVTFTDIPADAWYRGYIGAAVKAGITKGVNADEFNPHALITREEMAVMVANTLTFLDFTYDDAETADQLAHFADRDLISSWAQRSVAAAYDAGIIRGMTRDTFAPQNKATRAQAAVMIRGLLISVDFVN